MTDLQEHLLAQNEVPEDDESRERWSVGGDREATWALRKMAACDAEMDRLTADAAHEIEAIKAWLEAALTGPARDRSFFESKLIEYRRRLEADNPKLPLTYKVPGGVIARRKGSRSVVITDEQTFVEWALDNDPELVKLAPLKGGLVAKDALYKLPDVPENEDDGWVSVVVSGSGEKVPGVQVVRDPAQYGAKPEAVES